MGTKYRGTNDEVRALDLHIKLLRCARSIQEKIERHLAAAGFSENQFGILEALHHLGPLKPNVLGEKLLTSRPNITQLLDGLERRRLVERRRCNKDRRAIDVHLTPAGKAIIEPLFQQHLAEIVAAMRVLCAEEQETAARLLKRLGLQEAAPRDT